MLLGMGSVAVFLLVLIVLMRTSSRLIARFEPTSPSSTHSIPSPAPSLAGNPGNNRLHSVDNKLVAAISAAIHCYKVDSHH